MFGFNDSNGIGFDASQEYALCTHVEEYGNWLTPQSLVADIAAAIACFGRIAIKDQQFLDSPGFYNLWKTENQHWQQLFERLTGSKMRFIDGQQVRYDIPRVVFLIQKADTEENEFDQVVSRLHRWVVENHPWVAFGRKTASQLLGVEMLQSLQKMELQSEAVMKFASEAENSGHPGLVNMLRNLKMNWKSVIPVSYHHSWNIPMLNERFLSLERGIDWTFVQMGMGRKLKDGALEKMRERVSKKNIAPDLFAAIGSPILPTSKTNDKKENEWVRSLLHDLLSWTYVTGVAEEFKMATVHPTLGKKLYGELDSKKRLSNLLTAQYTWTKDSLSQLGDNNFHILDALVNLIESDTGLREDFLFPYQPNRNPEDPASIELFKELQRRLLDQLEVSELDKKSVFFGLIALTSTVILTFIPTDPNISWAELLKTSAEVLGLAGASFFGYQAAVSYHESAPLRNRIAEVFPERVWDIPDVANSTS